MKINKKLIPKEMIPYFRDNVFLVDNYLKAVVIPKFVDTITKLKEMVKEGKVNKNLQDPLEDLDYLISNNPVLSMSGDKTYGEHIDQFLKINKVSGTLLDEQGALDLYIELTDSIGCGEVSGDGNILFAIVAVDALALYLNVVASEVPQITFMLNMEKGIDHINNNRFSLRLYVLLGDYLYDILNKYKTTNIKINIELCCLKGSPREIQIFQQNEADQIEFYKKNEEIPNTNFDFNLNNFFETIEDIDKEFKDKLKNRNNHKLFLISADSNDVTTANPSNNSHWLRLSDTLLGFNSKSIDSMVKFGLKNIKGL